MSRRSFVDSPARSAIVGQFVSPRSLSTGILLCLVAVVLGRSMEVRINLAVVVVSMCVALVAAAVTIRNTWIRTPKWQVLRSLPVTDRALVRQMILVGAGVLVLDVIAPVMSFATVAGADHRVVPVICAAVVGVCAAGMALPVVSTSGLVPRGLAVVLWGACLGLWFWQVQAAALGALGAVVIVVALTRDFDDAPTRRSTRFRGTSLMLGELMTNSSARINTIGLMAMGGFFTWTMAAQGLTLPIGLAVVAANTPLNAYFSRCPSTRTMVVSCPGSWRAFARYYAAVACVDLLAMVPTVVVLITFGAHPVMAIGCAVTGAVAGAGAAWATEVWAPFTTWKSQREVLRHPRKYLPPLASLVAVTAVQVLPWS